MGESHADEYDDALVALLELIWGEGFLSPGGPAAVGKVIEGLDLTGKTVLDIGCGLGGIDAILARDRGARVIGLEIERALIARARRRIAHAELADRVDLRLVTPGPLPLADASVDVVFGKDSWIHVADKGAFFAETFRVLAPGGVLAASDWLRGPEPYSDDMRTFFELEGLTYHMETAEGYAAKLRAAGYVAVAVEDTADECRALAHDEYARMRGPLRAEMVAALGPEKTEHFIENWRMLTVVLDGRELRPAQMRARKPA